MFPLEGKIHEDKGIFIECAHDCSSCAEKKQTKKLTKISWIQK